MSATEEYFRIIYETKGEAALGELQSKLASVREEIAELSAANRNGIAFEEGFADSARKLGAEKAKLQNEIEALSKVMEDEHRSFEMVATAEQVAAEEAAKLGGATGDAVPVVASLKDRIAALTSELRLAATAYAQGSITTAQYKDRIAPLNVELGAATAATKALQGANVNAGRAMQEFMILSNELAMGRVRGMTATIGRLGAAFGGSAGLVGMIGMATLGVVELVKHWDELEKWWAGTKIPKVSGDLKEMEAALKDVNKELETMKGHRFDSLKSYDEYNAMVLAQLDLEKAITKEKTRQKEIDDMMKLRPLSETEEEKAKAKVMKERLGGEQAPLILAAIEEAKKASQYDERQAALQGSLRTNEAAAREAKAAREQALRDLNPLEAETQRAKLATAEKEAAHIKAKIAENERVVTEAGKATAAEAFKGNAAAFEDLQRAAKAHPKIVSDDIRKELERATPAGRQAVRDAAEATAADFEAMLKEWKETADEAKRKAHDEAERVKRVQRDMDRAGEEEEDELRRLAAKTARERAKGFKDEASDVEKGIKDEDKAAAKAARDQEHTESSMARRAMELVRHGIDTNTAMGEAQYEQQLLEQKLFRQLEWQKANANAIAARTQQMLRAMEAGANQMPMLNFGGP